MSVTHSDLKGRGLLPRPLSKCGGTAVPGSEDSRRGDAAETPGEP